MASSPCKILDGKALADTIRFEIKEDIAQHTHVGRQPCLGTVLVGDRPDSAMYVAFKHKACAEVGMMTKDMTFPVDASEEAVVEAVKQLNDDDTVDGILVQLPLPAHMNEEKVLSAISISKDVDGFSPTNIGLLCMKDRTPHFEPCTPKGCIEILRRNDIAISGKHAVVIGRSNIVGVPVANLLLQHNATVTVCHSRTPNIPELCRQADIVVAAIGRPEFVQASWIKPGAVVIDVGINSIPDASKKTGKRTVGDVSAEAFAFAGAMTPVPGGVGPMTIAMLLSNTMTSFKRRVLVKGGGD